MPVFNREQFVDEAIRSVVEQDFEDFELLVVDDGSTDRTAEVLDAWKKRDSRMVVVTSPSNQGISAALNLGLAHARGRYVARLDSDDLMTPRRLAAQVAVLDAQPEVVLVACAFDIVDLAGTHLRTWNEHAPREVTAFLLPFYNTIGHGTVMFRLADVLEEGGYSHQYPTCEDYDLWSRLSRRGTIETLPFAGMTKRTHPNQTPMRWDVKRASWSGIMRPALGRLLRRAVSDRELAALITLWRIDGTPGMSAIADGVLREAFARFPNRALHARLRRRIAHQWYLVARNFVRRRRPLESIRYLARAARWLL
jgi:glycosyltransferase involved in cell wall biosynthesis